MPAIGIASKGAKRLKIGAFSNLPLIGEVAAQSAGQGCRHLDRVTPLHLVVVLKPRHMTPLGPLQGRIHYQLRTSASVTGEILISTRRLAALPSSVAFDAIGWVSPKPRVPMRADWTPRLTR